MKYRLPAILYFPLLGVSYLIFDVFRTETLEIQDKNLQTTEFLNPDLPDATIKNGDGIGTKYENMAKSWGKIQDYTAVDNIERDEPNNNQENMNLNTRKMTSPCLENRSRKRLWQRKLPMPRSGSRKLSRSWKRHSPKRG